MGRTGDTSRRKRRVEHNPVTAPGAGRVYLRSFGYPVPDAATVTYEFAQPPADGPVLVRKERGVYTSADERWAYGVRDDVDLLSRELDGVDPTRGVAPASEPVLLINAQRTDHPCPPTEVPVGGFAVKPVTPAARAPREFRLQSSSLYEENGRSKHNAARMTTTHRMLRAIAQTPVAFDEATNLSLMDMYVPAECMPAFIDIHEVDAVRDTPAVASLVRYLIDAELARIIAHMVVFDTDALPTETAQVPDVFVERLTGEFFRIGADVLMQLPATAMAGAAYIQTRFNFTDSQHELGMRVLTDVARQLTIQRPRRWHLAVWAHQLLTMPRVPAAWFLLQYRAHFIRLFTELHPFHGHTRLPSPTQNVYRCTYASAFAELHTAIYLLYYRDWDSTKLLHRTYDPYAPNAVMLHDSGDDSATWARYAPLFREQAGPLSEMSQLDLGERPQFAMVLLTQRFAHVYGDPDERARVSEHMDTLFQSTDEKRRRYTERCGYVAQVRAPPNKHIAYNKFLGDMACSLGTGEKALAFGHNEQHMCWLLGGRFPRIKRRTCNVTGWDSARKFVKKQ